MQDLLLVRYGEIFLKGLNRPYFIRALVRKIRYAVRGMGATVNVHDGRIFVRGFADLDECVDRVTKVFGVHSVKEAGYRILNANPDLKVDVHHPDYLVNIEIRDMAYLYVKEIPAYGGMPVGTNGNATLLLSGGIDSPVAGWMIAKRGVQINAVHYHSYPYTSDRAKEKVLDLARKLSFSCCGIKVYVVPFTEIQMEIHEKCPEEYTTLIMRRYMMRIAERIARETESEALITGESIGQVASQTMTALGTTDAVVQMPVFRPLIGFDKSEIIEMARKIGTLEISEQPFEDCCTVFTPRHPATHPKMEKILEGESRLEEEALIQRALDGTEMIRV